MGDEAGRYEIRLKGHLDGRWAAWFEGLTPEGVKHQRWYKHVAMGRNIRTVDDLPILLTKKQAHHFLHAPDDFDIPSALRWAVITDLGGDERLVRSILQTRIGTAFIRCSIPPTTVPSSIFSSTRSSCPWSPTHWQTYRASRL